MERQREAGLHSHEAKHQVIWLMSSASPAEGGLISKTPRRAAWLEWRPADLSVKAVSERVKTQFLIHILRMAVVIQPRTGFLVWTYGKLAGGTKAQKTASWMWTYDEKGGGGGVTIAFFFKRDYESNKWERISEA